MEPLFNQDTIEPDSSVLNSEVSSFQEREKGRRGGGKEERERGGREWREGERERGRRKEEGEEGRRASLIRTLITIRPD